jgi:hypothetical protein
MGRTGEHGGHTKIPNNLKPQKLYTNNSLSKLCQNLMNFFGKCFATFGLWFFWFLKKEVSVTFSILNMSFNKPNIN